VVGLPPRERVRIGFRLTFPGGERDDQGYSVHRALSVRLFQSAMASLLGTDGPVSLYVGPTWLVLDHSGAVSDQVFPDTDLPCPFLQQDSAVRVERNRFSARVPRDDLEQFPSFPLSSFRGDESAEASSPCEHGERDNLSMRTPKRVKIASGKSRATDHLNLSSGESRAPVHENLLSPGSDWSKDTLSSTALILEEKLASSKSDKELGESSSERSAPAFIPVSRKMRRDLMRLFRGENRSARRAFRVLVKRE
jgi:hypothetical protein